MLKFTNPFSVAPSRVPELSTAVEPEAGQISFGQNSSNEIVEKLKVLDVNTLTPIEAMGVLYELTKSAKEI